MNERSLQLKVVARRMAALLFTCIATLTQTVHAEDLVVAAAASLSNAFGDIAKPFESAHPGTHVVLNFAASDVLLKQIEQGAPVDVFASADEVTMDRAASAGRIDASTRRNFAANALVLIVPTGSMAPTTLSVLKTDTYKRIAIGNPDSVPAGRYAKQALADAGLWDTLQDKFVQTQNVRQALDYVARAEADAGFVYATDAATQKQKVSVALSVPTATPVRYPAAATAASTQKKLAHEFVEFLLAAQSQTILASYGFHPVTP